MSIKNEARKKRAARIRKKISGTPSKPRLSVYRGANLYLQLIDDASGKTIVSSSSIDKDLKDKKLSSNKDSAKLLGKLLAEKAIKKGIKEIVFDRSGYIYTGVIKEVADAAREAGLKF